MKIAVTFYMEAMPMTPEECVAQGLDEETANMPADEIDPVEIGELICSYLGADSYAVCEAHAGSGLFVKLGDAEFASAGIAP